MATRCTSAAGLVALHWSGIRASGGEFPMATARHPRTARCCVIADRGNSRREGRCSDGSCFWRWRLALLAPASASAAKPAVTTGGVANLTPTTVTLNGKVDPNGKDTVYFFQIGTTEALRRQHAGDRRRRRRQPVRRQRARASASRRRRATTTGSSPATPTGRRSGKDRTFKTKVQPLGVTLAATPPTVAPGGATTLAGQLTGTNNATARSSCWRTRSRSRRASSRSATRR